MRGEEANLFRGTLVECMSHYSELLRDASSRPGDRVGFRAPMATFCGVTRGTAASWLRDLDRSQGGIKFFKVVCFLRLLGYHVTDLNKVRNTLLQECIEILGHSVFTDDQVAKELGIGTKSNLYKVLRGKVTLSEPREIRLRAFCKKTRRALTEKKERDARKHKKAIRLVDSASGNTGGGTQGGSRTHNVDDSEKNPIVLIMEGVTLLIDAGEQCLSDEALSRLSDKEAGAILQLSSRMSSLSSRVLEQHK